MMTLVQQRRFRKKLMDWYRANARDLPWRRSRDPYHIWVSEIMLQQTQVATVIPYYIRFLKRFPTIKSLAEASLDEVLPLWSGLGYYRRVRNLHMAAQLIVAHHGGLVPRDSGELLSLPGIGRYTAGAVLSLAYNLPHPVVDGNVVRVLCRVTAMTEDPRRAGSSKKIWRLAELLVAGQSPADFNQALMELGATICLSDRPQCRLCPVKGLCQGRLQGLADKIPFKRPPRRPERQLLMMVLAAGKGGRLLILKRDHPTLMTGLWEFPCIECAELAQGDLMGISSRFKSELGLRLAGLERIGQVRHAITYRRIQLQIFAARLIRGIPSALRSRNDARWMESSEQAVFGMSSLSLKAIRLLAGARKKR
jgi:A/G-specific adenine glycosylase